MFLTYHLLSGGRRGFAGGAAGTLKEDLEEVNLLLLFQCPWEDRLDSLIVRTLLE